jgi:hypothetical protein
MSLNVLPDVDVELGVGVGVAVCVGVAVGVVVGVTLAVEVEVGVGVGVAPPCSPPLLQPVAIRLAKTTIMRRMNPNLFISRISFPLNFLPILKSTIIQLQNAY